MEPKPANLTPKQVQNDHGGAKMTQTGPETGFLRFWGVFRAKNSSKMEPKWSKNRSNNQSKNDCFLMLARARFYLIFFNFPPKMVPKWTQMGTNIDPKIASCQKSGFRSHTAKQTILEGKVGFGASIFETRGDQKSMKKRSSIAMSILE